MRKRTSLLVVLLIFTFAVAARGLPPQTDFALTVENGGNDSVSVSPGDSFTLDITLDGGTINGFIFDLDLSQSGLDYDAYDFATGFDVGGFIDASDPDIADLTQTIGTSVHLESADLAFGDFSGGILAMVDMTVPEAFLPGDVTINVSSIEFSDDGFTFFDGTAGPNFTLTVLPEPATITAVLMIGGAVLTLRRRRRCACIGPSGFAVGCGCGSSRVGH